MEAISNKPSVWLQQLGLSENISALLLQVGAVLAVLHYFDLKVFQSPTGQDLLAR